MIGLFGISLVLARGAHVLTERALRLFAYEPGHRAYTVTRIVTFAVVFTTMYVTLLRLLAGTVASYGPPPTYLRGAAACAPAVGEAHPPGCDATPSVPIR